ncbi:MAG: DUF4124 domain-containing protein [Thioalkalispiraceae bacterium]
MITAMPSMAEIYRWVDEQGQVHFGDKPKGSDYEVIRQDGEDKENKKNNDISDEERAIAKEKARQERIKKMDALAEKLKADREARETEREKEKKELDALRAGCNTAFERINFLEKQLRNYIRNKSQSRGAGSRNKDPNDIALDTKHKRMSAELESRKKYVAENCQDL